MPVTTGMKGEGFYDEHSAPQLAAIAAVLPWLEDALGTMEWADREGPIVLADFGCSEGRNSIVAAKRLLAVIRARTTRPVQTVHCDLPTNNFNQLFANLFPAGGPSRVEPNVYSACVGGSMFDQLLPPGTASVAMTFNAIGYLDRKPQVPMTDYILPMGPGRPRSGVQVTREARQAYADQARDDLARFFLARARELVAGGKLLVASFGSGAPYRCSDGIYDVVNDALLDLVAARRIPRNAYEAIVFPVYFRTEEELVEPVVGAGSAAEKMYRLDRVGSTESPVPFNERLRENGDVKAYARDYTSFLRAFTEPILRLTLSGLPNLDGLFTELYAQIESRLAADPEGYALHYVQVAALFTRV